MSCAHFGGENKKKKKKKELLVGAFIARQEFNFELSLLDKKKKNLCAAEMEVGSGFSGGFGPPTQLGSGLTFIREIGLNRGHTT